MYDKLFMYIVKNTLFKTYMAVLVTWMPQLVFCKYFFFKLVYTSTFYLGTLFLHYTYALYTLVYNQNHKIWIISFSLPHQPFWTCPFINIITTLIIIITTPPTNPQSHNSAPYLVLRHVTCVLMAISQHDESE